MIDKETAIIIPVYNEAKVLRKVIENVRKKFYNVVCIDDGSSDASLDILKKCNVFILQHPFNIGQGAALQTGIEFAVTELNIKYVATFDSDGQHDISDILRLKKILIDDNLDVVLGSRFIKHGTSNISKFRKFILKLSVVFTRIVTGLNITDSHNGLRIFSISAAKKVKFINYGMAHASEVFEIIKKNKMKFSEAPVNIHYSNYSLRKGQSLFNIINILHDLILKRFFKN
ncbi:MAG: glycosyltransferase family 2 protein, partial [Spirochaetia bacterium]|nr:glycosyltransferase family 2 protein [Spirochaetia bacterium]